MRWSVSPCSSSKAEGGGEHWTQIFLHLTLIMDLPPLTHVALGQLISFLDLSFLACQSQLLVEPTYGAAGSSGLWREEPVPGPGTLGKWGHRGAGRSPRRPALLCCGCQLFSLGGRGTCDSGRLRRRMWSEGRWHPIPITTD